jgi:hypothetical protein
MKHVVLAFIALLIWELLLTPGTCDGFVGDYRHLTLAESPEIVASGEAFSVIAFLGAAPRPHQETHRPGLVILHSDLAHGEASWLMRGGTYVLPTRKIMWYTTRVIGADRLGSVLYVVSWENWWHETPPATFADLPAEQGSYFVNGFCLGTGQRVLRRELELSEDRPDQVPVETVTQGVLEKEELGLRVFGQILSADEKWATCA